MQVPFGFNTTEYTLVRRSSRLYEGFIPVVAVIGRSFSAGYLEVTLDQARSLDIILAGSTTTTISFSSEAGKVTTMLFTSLTSFTTTIGATQGGLAITVVDPAGRQLEAEQVLETRKGYFGYRSRPVGFFNQGVLIQSDAVILKSEGIRPQERDLVYVAGTTFSIVKADEVHDIAGDSFYRVDLKRIGREV